MLTRSVLLLMCGLFVVHLLLAGWLPPTEDELYYWCWSQQLQWSYFDHPPMVAILIRGSTELFGNNLFAIRFPACVCSFIVIAGIRHLMGDDRIFRWLLFTPLCVFGSMLMTPDIPLVTCWMAYIGWLIVSHRRLQNLESPNWLLGGVIFGLGFLSKYPMVMAAPACVLSFLVLRRGRHTWVVLGLAIHFAVAGLVALPVLIFNMQHDFAPLTFQWNHANQAGRALFRHFPEYLGGQVALVGIGPFAIIGWTLWKLRDWQDDAKLWACAWLFALPMVFFIYKGITGRLEANWPIFCYLSLGPIVVEAVRMAKRPALARRWVNASFAIPFIASVFIAWHMISPFGFVPPMKDRLTRMASLQSVHQQVKQQFNELSQRGEIDPSIPVYASQYQGTAMLGFAGIPAKQFPINTRRSNFTLTPDHPLNHEGMYVLCEFGPLQPNLVEGFEQPVMLAQFPLVVRDNEVSTYHLIYYRKTNTDVASRGNR